MRVLMLQTYPGANGRILAHFPYYRTSGCEKVVGVVTEGGGCFWPTKDTVTIGPDRYASGSHLPMRLLKSIEHGLALKADTIVVSEWDCLFFKPIPRDLPKGLVMTRTGGNSPGFEGQSFYHPPWIMDSSTAKEVLAVGYKLVADGRIEQGFPDRFIGLVAEVGGITVHGDIISRYTQNTIDRPEWVAEARAARRGGCHAVHGVKTQAVLNAITI